jgi:hypothetical protein
MPITPMKLRLPILGSGAQKFGVAEFCVATIAKVGQMISGGCSSTRPGIWTPSNLPDFREFIQDAYWLLMKAFLAVPTSSLKPN